MIFNERSHYSQGSNICGRGWKDRIKTLDKTINHTDSNLVLKVTSTLNQGATDESFGLSDIKIAYCDAGTC